MSRLWKSVNVNNRYETNGKYLLLYLVWKFPKICHYPLTLTHIIMSSAKLERQDRGTRDKRKSLFLSHHIYEEVIILVKGDNPSMTYKCVVPHEIWKWCNVAYSHGKTYSKVFRSSNVIPIDPNLLKLESFLTQWSLKSNKIKGILS
jgi:hypothetical protein